MKSKWLATEIILLAGGPQVKRLVRMYENEASDLKPLMKLEGMWNQFRFLFLWDNPLVLMAEVCNLFSKMSQLPLAGASELWEFFIFFILLDLIILFNPPANGTPGRAFQLHTISFISSVIKSSIGCLVFLNSFINSNRGFCMKNTGWHYVKSFQALIITFPACE